MGYERDLIGHIEGDYGRLQDLQRSQLDVPLDQRLADEKGFAFC